MKTFCKFQKLGGMSHVVNDNAVKEIQDIPEFKELSKSSMHRVSINAISLRAL